MAAKQLQEVLCTIHNLTFAYDADRVRALKEQPACMSCPVCARNTERKLRDEVEELQGHRNVLLAAIDLKKTLQPLDG